jgi:hypothetical protein
MNKGKKRDVPLDIGNCANPELCEYFNHNEILCQKCRNYRKRMQKSARALETN